jgi:tRNA A-37 threonylcarbamoyl transferase component Bud32
MTTEPSPSAESYPSSWTDIEQILDAAFDAAPEDRSALLQRVCSDPLLRAEIERLLGGKGTTNSFLDEPAAVYAAPLVSRLVEGPLLDSGTILGGYEVVRALGKGATATVYLARDARHHRMVAIKVLHPELATALGPERFLREIEIAATLQHPHILPLFDSGVSDGLLYYVMPHIAGESLRHRLEQADRITRVDAIAIAHQVAAALDYAHRHGVVHRDIKPENILLQDGQAIVADFGIAWAIDAAGAVRSSERSFATGTPAYMSPEQAKGDSRLDGRSDVYSLGCVVYEVLTGQPPFTGPTPRRILERHLTEPIPSLRALCPTIPKAVDGAVRQALAKRPDDRFATAGAFVRALMEAPTELKPLRGSRFRQIAVFLGAFLVAALALRYEVSLTHRSPTPAPPDPRLIAILPFRTSGAAPELTWLQDGMAELLAAKLGGQRELRVADPMMVMNGWQRVTGLGRGRITPDAAFTIARAVGAARVIDGAVAGTPSHLTLTAWLLRSPADRLAAEASVEGPVESLPVLADRLTMRLLSLAAGTEALRLSSISSGSLPALRAYLAGRAAFRRGRLREAFNDFREATLLDSTFALAALELVHTSKWVALNGEEAQWGSRLALAGRERLAPGERALVDAWVRPGTTRPEVMRSWQTATQAYPDQADLWYGLGDFYYHEGALAGLPDPLRMANEAFQRGWALDSARGIDSLASESAPIFAEPLSHMVEIAQVRSDTASVGRLTRLGLAADSTSAQGWYLRWHRALGRGPVAENLFWADSQQVDPETFVLIHRFTAWTNIAPEDYWRSADLMLRRGAFADPPAANLQRRVLALNGGRPHDSAVTGDPDPPGVTYGAPVREALYWGGDTILATQLARRMARFADQVGSRGEAQQRHIQSLCTLAAWRLAHGDVRYAESAAGRLESAVIAGLPPSDSVPVAQAALACAALLEATRASTLRLPNARAALERADSLVRTYYVGQSLGANLMIAQAAEAQGDLGFALRAIRRRAGGYVLLPMWYLSTYLREEGRLAALTGDIPGSIRAYRQYLALRPNPEPSAQAEIDEVRAELANLAGGLH